MSKEKDDQTRKLKEYFESLPESSPETEKGHHESRIGCAFWEAFIFTTIPIILLSIGSAFGYKSEYDPTGHNIWAGSGYVLLWFFAAFLWVILLVIAIVFTFKRKGQTAIGVWVGVCIGIISLIVSYYFAGYII